MDMHTRFIESYVHNNGIGVLIELSSSVLPTSDRSAFAELAKRLAMQIAAMAPLSTEDLLYQPFLFDTERTVDQAIQHVGGANGNIEIVRYVRWSTSQDGSDPEPPRGPAVIAVMGGAT
jgi:elongation factor Ts